MEPSAENEVTSAEVLSSLPVLIREVCPLWVGVALCRHACDLSSLVQCHRALDTKGPATPDGLELWMSVAEQALHTMWNLV